MALVSNIQKERIIEYLKQGKRFDGRKPEEFRNIEVKMGISKNAEGSCSVKFGESEVYCGVKLDVMEPFPDSEDEGILMTTAELSPMASPDFETGPPRIEAIELGRVIDRGVRESGFIDFKKLCIKKGEKVWAVFIDIYAVNDSGNLIDLAGLAALIALGNAKMPVYDEATEKVDREKGWTKDGLPLNEKVMSLNMSFYKIGNSIIVDPVLEEQGIVDYRLSLALSSDGKETKISSIQKSGEGAIDKEDMEKILKLAVDKWKEMQPQINKFVWGK
jgi:exosome complex component RRP42